MMLVHYQGQPVGMVGATRFSLTAEFTADRRPDDVDAGRVTEVCGWALSVRRVAGCEPGRVPGNRSAF